MPTARRLFLKPYKFVALPHQLHNLPKHRMYCSSTYIIFVLGGIAWYANAHTSYFETFYSLPDAGDYNQHSRNALRMARYKWPDAIVPFAFQEDAYTELEQEAVRGAMASLSNSTCVQFVPKSEQHKHHIRFYKSNGCGAYIGYRDNLTEMPVSFSPYCLTLRGAIQHELLHVLGLLHEQSRPDRDEYVRIVWANIEPQFVQNFGKTSWEAVETFGLPYDFDSLMHYPGNAFAKSAADNVTIYALADPKRKLGQSDGPTFYDLEKIRRMYDC